MDDSHTILYGDLPILHCIHYSNKHNSRAAVHKYRKSAATLGKFQEERRIGANRRKMKFLRKVKKCANCSNSPLFLKFA